MIRALSKTLKIKRSCVLFCCVFLSAFQGDGQITTSLFFDSAGTGIFTEDAIYFVTHNGIIKTDYNLNIIWKKHIPGFCGNIFGNAMYGVTDTFFFDVNIVYKLDTAGNEIWRKSFAAPPHPLAPLATTQKVYTTPGRNRVYVNTYQLVGSYPYNYYTQITLDSAANFVGAWYIDPNNQYYYSYEQPGVGSLRGGAWILRKYDDGVITAVEVNKYDATGQQDQLAKSIGSGPADYHSPYFVTILPDSNYIFVDCYYISYYQTQWISCIKFDDWGNIIWSSVFQSHYHDSSGNSISKPYCVTGDKDGNTYLYAGFMDSTSSLKQGEMTRPAILKINKIGRIVYLKSWSDQKLGEDSMGLGNLYYHDGNIYAGAYFKNINNKGAVMVFDTGFNHPCYAPDTTFVIDTTTSSASSWGPVGMSPDTFTYSPATLMDSVSHTIYDQLISRDLCNTLNVADELIVRPDFFLSPNPTHNQIQFQSSLIRGGVSCSIEIFDAIGNLVFEKQNCSVGEKLNLSFLEAGFYILKATSLRNVFSGKFVKF